MTGVLPAPGTLEFAELADAFAALEEAVEPVAADAFAALADPGRRAQLARLAAGAGRVLVPVGDGWLTGYDDTVADRLVDEGTGVLDAIDRAVLALVLIHTVVVPRARGALADDDWGVAVGVKADDLAVNKSRALTKDAIGRSLRRLRERGVVVSTPIGGIVPGSQLRRLTDDRRAGVTAALFTAARPHGVMAAVARRTRAERRARRGGAPI